MRVDSPVPPTRPGWLSRAIVSGFYATLVMLITFLLAYVLAQGLANIELADKPRAPDIQNAFHNLAHNPLIDLAAANLYAAMAIHFTTGLVWALIYARFAEPRLSGPGWQRGMFFSLLPWVLSIVVFFPVVGAGVFGFGLRAGLLPVIGNFILHLAYGGTLGLLYSPVGDIDVEELHTASGVEFEVMRHSEDLAAKGIVIGAVVGVALGIVVALTSGAGDTVLGIPPAAVVVTLAVLIATAGGFIGSMFGLTPTHPRSS